MIERIGQNKLQLMELWSGVRQWFSDCVELVANENTHSLVQVAGALHGDYLSAGPAAFVGVQEDGQPWQFTSQPAQSVMFV